MTLTPVHIRLIAVGERQPAWVDKAFEDYARRLPRQWRFRLDSVHVAPRKAAFDAAAQEGKKLLSGIRGGERVVLLDEAGELLSSIGLAARLDAWQSGGADLALVIGGPDGVSAEVAARADFHWSLSPLTLPHGLARVVVAEQLYRAWSITQGHPYHRGSGRHG